MKTIIDILFSTDIVPSILDFLSNSLIEYDIGQEYKESLKERWDGKDIMIWCDVIIDSE